MYSCCYARSEDTEPARIYLHIFLGSFAKLQKATIIFIMSVYLPVPLDGISSNFQNVYFSKICRKNSGFIKIRQEQLVLYMETSIHL
jgi:hypothetical protein